MMPAMLACAGGSLLLALPFALPAVLVAGVVGISAYRHRNDPDAEFDLDEVWNSDLDAWDREPDDTLASV